MSSDVVMFKMTVIGIVSIIFAVLFFCFKVDACKSTPDNCVDEFKPSDNGYTASCKTGATIEAVQSPKPGFFCHCAANPHDAGQ